MNNEIGLISDIFNGTTSLQEIGFKMCYSSPQNSNSEPSNFNDPNLKEENYAEELIESLQRGKGGDK